MSQQDMCCILVFTTMTIDDSTVRVGLFKRVSHVSHVSHDIPCNLTVVFPFFRVKFLKMRYTEMNLMYLILAGPIFQRESVYFEIHEIHEIHKNTYFGVSQKMIIKT